MTRPGSLRVVGLAMRIRVDAGTRAAIEIVKSHDS